MNFHFQIRDAFDVFKRFLHLFRFGLKHVQVLPVNPDDNGIARAGEHFANSLLQISLHVADEPGITIHGFLNPLHGLVVVHRRINAHPVFSEIDAIRFIGQRCLTYVRTGIANAGNLQQLGASSLRDANHFRLRRARSGDPVHQEIPFLERGKQIPSEKRQN